MEQQNESPYKWFMDSRFNTHFGGTYNHSTNLNAYSQADELQVPQGGDNLIKDIGGATHTMEFSVIKNDGNNDAIMKFVGAGDNTSGYKWYLGVNEIWASSIGSSWIKLYEYGVGGNTKLSIFSGLKVTGGG